MLTQEDQGCSDDWMKKVWIIIIIKQKLKINEKNCLDDKN